MSIESAFALGNGILCFLACVVYIMFLVVAHNSNTVRNFLNRHLTESTWDINEGPLPLLPLAVTVATGMITSGFFLDSVIKGLVAYLLMFFIAGFIGFCVVATKLLIKFLDKE